MSPNIHINSHHVNFSSDLLASIFHILLIWNKLLAKYLLQFARHILCICCAAKTFFNPQKMYSFLFTLTHFKIHPAGCRFFPLPSLYNLITECLQRELITCSWLTVYLSTVQANYHTNHPFFLVLFSCCTFFLSPPPSIIHSCVLRVLFFFWCTFAKAEAEQNYCFLFLCISYSVCRSFVVDETSQNITHCVCVCTWWRATCLLASLAATQKKCLLSGLWWFRFTRTRARQLQYAPSTQKGLSLLLDPFVINLL